MARSFSVIIFDEFAKVELPERTANAPIWFVVRCRTLLRRGFIAGKCATDRAADKWNTEWLLTGDCAQTTTYYVHRMKERVQIHFRSSLRLVCRLLRNTD